MDRYTRKDAEQSFLMLCKALGKKPAENWDDVGAWKLDWNNTYGGGYIVEITQHTYWMDGKEHIGIGEDPAVWHRRLNAREFCSHVSFVLRVLEATDYD